jgi:SWI/SNF-related matrix-associated actin-dependent regulator of chromatin subfamily A member 5
VLCEENEEQAAWIEGMESTYKEQHDIWKQHREESQREQEKRDKEIAVRKEKKLEKLKAKAVESVNGKVIDDDEELSNPSPPALTDTSLPTPALAGSRVSTPKFMEPPLAHRGTKRGSDAGLETRVEKKARLDAQAWSVGDDPLMRGA